LLDKLDLFNVFPFPIIVSSGTLAILEHMLLEEKMSQSSRVGFVQEAGGRIQFRETTEEFKARRLGELKQLVDTVKSRCEVRSCSQLAYLPPEKRNQLIQLFGQHGAESMVLASEPGSLIWTDDMTVAGAAREFANIARVSTHLVLQYLNKIGVVDSDAYLEATAKLAGWGHYFTSINADAVIVSGRLADWNPQKWPLKECLQYLTVDSVPALELRNLVVNLIAKLYRERLFPQKQCSVMVAILDRLAKSRGTDFILAIRRLLPGAFSIDVVGARDALNMIDAWLTARLCTL
jgi:hypothetical protein